MKYSLARRQKKRRTSICLKHFPRLLPFSSQKFVRIKWRKVTALFLTRHIRQCQDFANRRFNFPTKWTWKLRLHFDYSFCRCLNSWIRTCTVFWYACRTTAISKLRRSRCEVCSVNSQLAYKAILWLTRCTF